jgi:hypothetical protein
VADTQNITLALPKALLREVKRLAADRGTSVSALMATALDQLTTENRRFAAARRGALAAMAGAKSMGTGGRRSWTRDDLHER